MKLRQVRSFISLARTGTFSEAARRVNVSQPALSQQIKKLETELDVKLVERMGKRIKLTEQGENFLPEAMRVLDSVRSAEASVQSNGSFSQGQLKLGIIPTIAPYFLPTLMDELNPESGELELLIREQQTDTLLQQLKIGKVDHLLLSPPIPEEGITIERLGQEPFSLAVSEDEPIARQDEIQIDDITDEPILLLEEGHCLRDQTLSFCERQNVQPNVVFQGSNMQSILNLIDSGFGYTFVPEMVIRNSNHDRIRYIPFSEPRPARDIILVHRQSTDLTDLDRHVYAIAEEWFNRS